MRRRASRIERLARREEKATIKRIAYLSTLSLILAVLLFIFGVGLLGKFADVLNVVFRKNDATSQSSGQIQPPLFDEIDEFTNKDKLSVSGFSQGASLVKVFINEEVVGEAKVENGKFKLDDISLGNGENRISGKSVSEPGEESEFSPTKTIVFDKEEPKLEIETPTEGQTFIGDNRVKVKGKTENDAQVYANGFLATVNSDGVFEVLVPLKDGENNIEIKALDSAGNTKVESRKVFYSK